MCKTVVRKAPMLQSFLPLSYSITNYSINVIKILTVSINFMLPVRMRGIPAK